MQNSNNLNMMSLIIADINRDIKQVTCGFLDYEIHHNDAEVSLKFTNSNYTVAIIKLPLSLDPHIINEKIRSATINYLQKD